MTSIILSQAISMVACWAEDPDGEAFKKHLARIPDYLWVSEDGMTMQVLKHTLFRIKS